VESAGVACGVLLQNLWRERERGKKRLENQPHLQTYQRYICLAWGADSSVEKTDSKTPASGRLRTVALDLVFMCSSTRHTVPDSKGSHRYPPINSKNRPETTGALRGACLLRHLSKEEDGNERATERLRRGEKPRTSRRKQNQEAKSTLGMDGGEEYRHFLETHALWTERSGPIHFQRVEYRRGPYHKRVAVKYEPTQPKPHLLCFPYRERETEREREKGREIAHQMKKMLTA